MDLRRAGLKVRSNPKYAAVLWILLSLMWSGLIWFIYWNMTDLLYGGPFPTLDASPALLTYLVCILTIIGIAVVLKSKERSKPEMVFYGIALISALVMCLVFVLLSFVLLYPSAMLPFAPPRHWMDGVFVFAFLVLWMFSFVGVLSTLLDRQVPPAFRRLIEPQT